MILGFAFLIAPPDMFLQRLDCLLFHLSQEERESMYLHSPSQARVDIVRWDGCRKALRRMSSLTDRFQELQSVDGSYLMVAWRRLSYRRSPHAASPGLANNKAHRGREFSIIAANQSRIRFLGPRCKGTVHQRPFSLNRLIVVRGRLGLTAGGST